MFFLLYFFFFFLVLSVHLVLIVKEVLAVFQFTLILFMAYKSGGKKN